MSTTTEELEATLESEKEMLRETISELGDRAQTAVDWRHHYRQHTGLALGAAVVAGVVLGLGGPRGRRVRSQAASAVAAVPRAAASVAPAVRTSLNSSLNSISAMVIGRLLGAAEDAVRRWARQHLDNRNPRQGQHSTMDPRSREPEVLH